MHEIHTICMALMVDAWDSCEMHGIDARCMELMLDA